MDEPQAFLGDYERASPSYKAAPSNADYCDCMNSKKNQIFERSVQDPFCDRLDYEEEEEDGDRPTSMLVEEELDPLAELDEGDDNITAFPQSMSPSLCMSPPSSRHSVANSIGSKSPILSSQSVCSHCHKVKRSRSRSFASIEGLSLHQESNPVSRTSSFILPLSKQPTRQSISSAQEYGNVTAFSQEDTPIASAQSIALNFSARPSNGSRSSINLGSNAIPTHLYSLERFVSSELDSATESFFDDSKQLCDEAAAPGSISNSFTKLTMSSPNTLKNYFAKEADLSSDREESSLDNGQHIGSTKHKSAANNDSSFIPPFLDIRKRRKSFIELALSESFS